MTDPQELWMSTDSGATWSNMPGFAVPSYAAIRISVSMAAPTSIYAFIGNNVAQQVWACSPVSVNCNFKELTPPPINLLTQAPGNMVLLADPNNATRAYVGGFATYLRIDNVNFVSGSAKYTSIYGNGFTSDGSTQHVDGRAMIMDANGDLLEGIIQH